MPDTPKVRVLPRAKREPDAEIVAMLEDLLERAKTGELVDLVVIYSTKDTLDHDYKINDGHFTMAGYMSRIQRDIESIGDDE